MGYPRDMDEYTQAELELELARRATLRAAGLCDYCSRTGNEPPCKFPERHALAVGKVVRTFQPFTQWAVVDTDNFGSDYPDERFVENTDARGVTEEVAKRIAATHNDQMHEFSKRYYKVVKLPYTLQPGFQP